LYCLARCCLRCRLRLRRRWIRSRLNRHNRSRRSGRIRGRNRARAHRRTTDGRLQDEARPGITIALPVPRQQTGAHDQQKQGEVETGMAPGRFVLQQVVQVTVAFIAQPQKRRAAHRDSDFFASCDIWGCRRRGPKRSPAQAAETILRIILLAALHASHCHGYWHHYTNSDADWARPFGIPPYGTWLSSSKFPKHGIILRDFTPQGSSAHRHGGRRKDRSDPRQMLRRLSMTPCGGAQGSFN
jgi:hypothetical protein